MEKFELTREQLEALLNKAREHTICYCMIGPHVVFDDSNDEIIKSTKRGVKEIKPEPDITGDGKGVNFNNTKAFDYFR